MAAQLMRQWNIGVLPIVDNGFRRRLVGVVTDRDLCLRVVAEGRDPGQVIVRECMSRQAVCCGPDDDAAHALRLMREQRVRRLPVLDEQGVLAGMISLSDLVRCNAVGAEELMSATAHICERAATGRDRAA
jgi:CBS domain-containing protein